MGHGRAAEERDSRAAIGGELASIGEKLADSGKGGSGANGCSGSVTPGASQRIPGDLVGRVRIDGVAKSLAEKMKPQIPLLAASLISFRSIQLSDILCLLFVRDA